MPPVEFKPAISAGERPQTYALDRAATGTDTDGSVPLYTQQTIACCVKLMHVCHIQLFLEIKIHPLHAVTAYSERSTSPVTLNLMKYSTLRPGLTAEE